MKNIFRFIKVGDKKLFYIINNKIKCKPLDLFMPHLTKLGGSFFSIFAPLLLIILGKNEISLIAKEAFVALSISHIFVQILKRTIGRERPYKILKEINTFKIDLKDKSFPSGHTTAIFSIITSFAINLPHLKFYLFTVAYLIGISRIYLGVHYPSDVLTGILLGYSTSILVHPYF